MKSKKEQIIAEIALIDSKDEIFGILSEEAQKRCSLQQNLHNLYICEEQNLIQ